MPKTPGVKDLERLAKQWECLGDRIDREALRFVRRSKDKKEQERAIEWLCRFVWRVDPGIEDLITYLNLLGFDTIFSCESHWPDWKISPYVMFGSMLPKPKEKTRLQKAMREQKAKLDLLLKAFYIHSSVPTEHRLVTKSKPYKGRIVKTAFLLENRHCNTDLDKPPEELALLAYYRRKEFMNFGKFLKTIWENS